MTAHRHPPLPHWNSGKGRCRWCGESVLKNGLPNLRALWHPNCVKAYNIATSSQAQRQAVWNRDKGRCAKCGTIHKRSGDWQADHIHPLFKVDRTLPLPQVLHFFSMENLQTLCSDPCHKEKSRAEMSAHHAARKAAASENLKGTSNVVA